VSPRNRNELWARVLLDELARAGVRHAVVAPGSRSTPLVLALAADPRFRTAVQVDERSAGFLALGVGKATGVPAAVITTSGTAVANLLPAVVEASQAEVPLLLLTADRPSRLRGADANQAIDQVHLFGRYARLFQELSPAEVSDRTLRHLRSVASRAVAAAVGDPPGPVHLNLAFEKPLEPVPVPGDLPDGLAGTASLALGGRPDSAPFTRIHPRRLHPSDEVLEALAARLASARRPLLVAGPVPRPWESGPAILELARGGGLPLLADPLSGARDDGPGCGYDLALRVPELRSRLAPDLVVRFGTTPSSASLASWLSELRDVPQVVVDGGDRWKDHLGVAAEVVPGDPMRVAADLADRLLARWGGAEAWASLWCRVDAAVRSTLAPALEADFFEGAAAVAAAEHARMGAEAGILFVSNSMPVRDVDALWPLGCGGGRPEGPMESAGAPASPDTPAVPASPPSPPLRILGNRGASGIDGIVSTALGVAWGSGAPVTVLVGDLALVHDMNGLLRARGFGGADGVKVDFVVVNNNGGGIFHLLPVRDFEPDFTRFVATPHGLEPERIAALHDLPFRRVEGRGGFGAAGDPDAPDAPVTPGALPRIREGLAWARRQSGSVILEIRTDRDENRRRHVEVAEQVRAALLSLLAAPGSAASLHEPESNLP
jgi:2-succinyl-5-enolpyruvyl-6-hydroxy-3-cyclohexene-1-carboxylate synthase